VFWQPLTEQPAQAVISENLVRVEQTLRGKVSLLAETLTRVIIALISEMKAALVLASLALLAVCAFASLPLESKQIVADYDAYAARAVELVEADNTTVFEKAALGALCCLSFPTISFGFGPHVGLCPELFSLLQVIKMFLISRVCVRRALDQAECNPENSSELFQFFGREMHLMLGLGLASSPSLVMFVCRFIYLFMNSFSLFHCAGCFSATCFHHCNLSP